MCVCVCVCVPVCVRVCVCVGRGGGGKNDVCANIFLGKSSTMQMQKKPHSYTTSGT